MENMTNQKSKVYALTDAHGRITRIEGGYTLSNIDDIAKWVYLDEGYGDRFNLCQCHYLDGGLMTQDGIYRYKLEDGAAVLRSEAEIEADRAARPEPEEPEDETILDILADQEYRICMLELGGDIE